MSKHLQYAAYVLKHKWYVLMEMVKVWRNNPLEIVLLWRALTHDLSKFRPSEWGPYAEYFYGNSMADWEKALTQRRFDAAWNRHQKRNSHHWQYWILQQDDGQVKILAMPEIDIIEMICDWRGAGRAVGKPDTAAWYRKNYDNIVLHAATRHRVNYWLNVFDYEAAHVVYMDAAGGEHE